MRPLKQITGEAEFNEVFTKMSAYHATTWWAIYTTAGWSVLACSCTSGPPILAQANLQVLIKDLMDLARQRGETKILSCGSVWPASMPRRGVKYYGYRSLTKRLRGLRPGPEGSVHRLALTRLSQQAQELAMELQGPYSQLMHGSPCAIDEGAWQFGFLRSRSATIAAGRQRFRRISSANGCSDFPKAKEAAGAARGGDTCRNAGLRPTPR